MLDYLKRFLIAGIVAICVSLLFFGGKPQAQGLQDQWIWPTDGVISDTYGTRHGHHKGIDIAGNLNSPIYAVYDGVVSKSYYSDTYGHVIFIKHNNRLETVYAHLNKRFVSEGQEIKKGTTIGLMGNTGSSYGVHLHFEVHQNEWTFEKENAINPTIVLGAIDIGHNVESSMEEENVEHVVKSVQPVETKIESTKNEIDHIVESGETLWSIAEKYSMDVNQLINSNSLSDSKIFENQIIHIPQSSDQVYIVQNGDTLSSISTRNNVMVEELIKFNRLTNDTIFPSQVILLPKR